MILDKQEEFADSMTIGTTAASNVAATNVIDTLLIQYPFRINEAYQQADTATGTASTRDLGIGEPIWFVIQMDAAAAGGTNATWSLVSSASSTVTSSPTTHLTTGAIADAALLVGTTIFAAMLPSGSYLRYLGVLLTTTGTHSAGTYSAFLTRNIQKNVNYPAPYLVG